MNALNISENIIRLRHERKLTQEQLAGLSGDKGFCLEMGKQGKVLRILRFYRSLPPSLMLPLTN